MNNVEEGEKFSVQIISIKQPANLNLNYFVKAITILVIKLWEL